MPSSFPSLLLRRCVRHLPPLGLLVACLGLSACYFVQINEDNPNRCYELLFPICSAGSPAQRPPIPADQAEAIECDIPYRRLGFPSGRRVEENGQFNWGQVGQRPVRWEGAGVKHVFALPQPGGSGCLGDHALHLNQLDGTGRAEAYQIIDLGPFARPDTSFAGARMLVDREDTALSGPNPATTFELRLSAFDGLPTTYVHRLTIPLATTSVRLMSDDDRDTWEELTVSLPLPPGTRYLVMAVAALGPTGATVSTHYVDGVRVALLDELASPPYDIRMDLTQSGRTSFWIVLENEGPNEARNVAAQIAVPGGFNPRISTGGVTNGTFNATSMQWAVGHMPPGAIRQLSLAGDPSDGTFTAALIRGLDGDTDASNNRLSASTTSTTGTYDLAIGEATGISGRTYVPDDLFGAQVWVQNTGPNDALGVEVTLPPDGYRVLPSSVSTVVGSFDPTTGIWSVGDIASGDVVQLLFSARTTYSSGEHTFTASITNGIGGDTSSSNNTLLAPFTIQNTSYDIRVNAPTPSTSFPSVNESFTVNFTFRNDGPDLVRLVEASVPLPDELAFLSFSGQSGITYDPATGLATFNGIGPGQTKGFTLTLSGTQRGIVTIPAEVTYAPADTDPSNNRFTVDIDVRR